MKILDTTLRDGSYVNNFSFTLDETRFFTRELSRLGLELIEVGHGIGLGATEKGISPAVETDQDYMKAAALAVEESGSQKAKWGMFCIPGIAELNHIDLAHDHNMGFIRIGVTVEDINLARSFVEKSKKLGLYVCVNFMKSYTSSPQEFSAAVAQAASFGADIAYLVDSAGTMVPADVEDYFRTVRRNSILPLGFHGHNNLGLANINAYTAYNEGAGIVDVSMQGMGRCTGNTSTEHFLALLGKQGIAHNLDPIGLMDLSEKYVRPKLTDIGIDSVDVACGLAGFHSSYMSVIKKYSLEYDIDPRRLIIELCKETRDAAPEKLVKEKAEIIKKQDKAIAYQHAFPLDKYFGSEQMVLSEMKNLRGYLFKTLNGASDCVTDLISGENRSRDDISKTVNRIIAFFQENGLVTGDKVMLKLPNSFGLFCIYLACLKYRCVAVPVSPSSSDDDIAYFKSITDPKIFISDADFLNTLPEEEANFSTNYDNKEDLFLISFTSGTTGKPKAIVHKAEAILGNAAEFNASTGSSPDDRLLHILPMHYMAGILNTIICPMLAGAEIVMDNNFSAITALTFWKKVIENQVTTFWLSPTMASSIMQLDKNGEINAYIQENALKIFVGTSPLSYKLKDKFEQKYPGVELLESYGLSELLLVSSNIPTSITTKKNPNIKGSVGRLLPSCNVEIREDGKIHIKTPFAFKEYLGAQTDLFDEEGYFYTGDIGYVKENRLYITGREKDLIIKGGINISPKSIEETLLECEQIEDVAVVGFTSEFYGEDIAAFVIAKNSAATEDDIKHFCKSNIPKQLRPTVIKFVEDFPKNANGKLQKSKLVEMLED
ncbi:putative4-hydroxy-2-oxovalerate aldolase/acyl-CoA ligase-fusion protein [Octadecabacter arcticus 238]|jgi:4-hydroxy 2-oxovalerate aldolase|uniref:Putative4-hydroxy-2-oxovalerate aldolase/acyl-CoA ligase-fusion protein n=1 Tax=Octadecabacter arcticus 238 TaxID=391616 RepID=M9RQ25_9RHOB|nr:AMP-binding protein [Octadecabacter arcticus]AGI72501.1 putative4-hydroxy-2-oxovalerate aldolase/acyl-CoA ligase-fusion protein [Octadecabacter arcticus 238]